MRVFQTPVPLCQRHSGKWCLPLVDQSLALCSIQHLSVHSFMLIISSLRASHKTFSSGSQSTKLWGDARGCGLFQMLFKKGRRLTNAESALVVFAPALSSPFVCCWHASSSLQKFLISLQLPAAELWPTVFPLCFPFVRQRLSS